jgi:hypothetical protein
MWHALPWAHVPGAIALRTHAPSSSTIATAQPTKQTPLQNRTYTSVLKSLLKLNTTFQEMKWWNRELQ